jgi:integrase
VAAPSRRHFGSTRKLPSGRWQAGYWYDGTRHIAPDTFTNKTDALAFLSTVETDLRRGSWIDPASGRTTLTDFAVTWLAQRSGSGKLSERTVELYGWLFDRHIAPSLGAVEIGRLRPSAVRAWHAQLATEHPSTAAKSYRLLSTMMRTAVADGLVLQSPCRIEGAGAERAPERPVASVAQVDALVAAMPEHLRAAVLLAAWCQLRRAELLGMRRRHLDLLHRTIGVEETRVTTMAGRVVTKAPKTAAGRRTVAIPPNIIAALFEHLGRFVAPDPEAPVFPVTSRSLDIAWERARKTVGVPELRLHDLRHTGLTWAAASGASVAELMRRGGHASPAAALRYQHATEDRDQAIAAALAQLAEPKPLASFPGTEASHRNTRSQDQTAPDEVSRFDAKSVERSLREHGVEEPLIVARTARADDPQVNANGQRHVSHRRSRG